MPICANKKFVLFMKKISKYLNPVKLFTAIRGILNEKNGWRKLLGLFLVYTKLCYIFKIRRNGYKLIFFPTALSVTLFQDKNAWRFEEIFLEKYLRENDVVIDVGANIGNVGIRAASLFKSVKVYMIEAHPEVYKFMTLNIELNGLKNIIPFNLAVGNRENDSVKFSNQLSDDLNSVLMTQEEGILVPIRKLDSLVRSEHVDFLKIDVEGFELGVLQGAVGILNNVSCIMFESWDEHFQKYGTNSTEVFAFLKEYGFFILNWNDGAIVQINSEHRSLVCENLFAVKDIDYFKRRLGQLN